MSENNKGVEDSGPLLGDLVDVEIPVVEWDEINPGRLGGKGPGSMFSASDCS